MAAIAILLGTRNGKTVAVGNPGEPDPVKDAFRAALTTNGIIDGVQYSELQVIASVNGRIKRKSFVVAEEPIKAKSAK